MATIASGIQLNLGPFLGVTVDVTGAVEDSAKDVSLNYLCTGRHAGEGDVDNPLLVTENDGTQVIRHAPAQTRQTLGCRVCGNEAKDTFKRGKSVGGGQYAMVPQEFLDSIGVEELAKKRMPVRTHPAKDLNSALYGEKTYYLRPTTAAHNEAYALLYDRVSRREDRAFVIVWAVRTACKMYRLEAFNGALVLRELVWPHAVREAPEVPHDGFKPAYVDLANDVIDDLCEPFDPESYYDDRSRKLAAYIKEASPVTGATDTEKAAVEAPAMDLGAQLALAAEAARLAKLEKVAAEVPADVTPVTKAPARRRTTRKDKVPA